MRLVGYLRRERGFTLVELMITLLILGILVTIVMLTMAVSKDRANEASCKASLRTIFDAITHYQTQHDGEYPPDLDTLTDEQYIKSSFAWTCPSGDLGTISGDYRTYYSSLTGHTSCPREDHNP